MQVHCEKAGAGTPALRPIRTIPHTRPRQPHGSRGFVLKRQQFEDLCRMNRKLAFIAGHGALEVHRWTRRRLSVWRAHAISTLWSVARDGNGARCACVSHRPRSGGEDSERAEVGPAQAAWGPPDLAAGHRPPTSPLFCCLFLRHEYFNYTPTRIGLNTYVGGHRMCLKMSGGVGLAPLEGQESGNPTGKVTKACQALRCCVCADRQSIIASERDGSCCKSRGIDTTPSHRRCRFVGALPHVVVVGVAQAAHEVQCASSIDHGGVPLTGIPQCFA